MAVGGLGAEQPSLSVSHKLGSEKSHGTPSEDEQREGGGCGGGAAVCCFSPTSSPADLCFRSLSVVLSRAVISFCRALFLLLMFVKGGVSGSRERLVICPLIVEESFSASFFRFWELLGGLISPSVLFV